MRRVILLLTVMAATSVFAGGAVLAAKINGTDRDDRLVGTPNIDTIRGFAGDDTMLGRGGSDSLRGGAGADTIRGEGDHDRSTATRVPIP